MCQIFFAFDREYNTDSHNKKNSEKCDFFFTTCDVTGVVSNHRTGPPRKWATTGGTQQCPKMSFRWRAKLSSAPSTPNSTKTGPGSGMWPAGREVTLGRSCAQTTRHRKASAPGPNSTTSMCHIRTAGGRTTCDRALDWRWTRGWWTARPSRWPTIASIRSRRIRTSPSKVYAFNNNIMWVKSYCYHREQPLRTKCQNIS